MGYQNPTKPYFYLAFERLYSTRTVQYLNITHDVKGTELKSLVMNPAAVRIALLAAEKNMLFRDSSVHVDQEQI